MFWENDEGKVEVEEGVKEEEEVEEGGANTFEDPVTSDKEQTSDEPQEVKDEDGGSVISSIDITEDQDEKDSGIMEERAHIARECEEDNKDDLDQEEEKLGDCHGEEDFVMVTPVLEDEEEDELVLELEDDDLFFHANKSKDSLMISS